MSNENRVNRAEINRLNKAIAQEEQNINAVFQRMGQIYFAAHQDEPEETQRENVTAVRMAMDRARHFKDQINVLRGIALCPNCKAEVSVNAAFCSCCGTRMPARTMAVPVTAEAMICPSCGNRCAPGTRFCSRCGTRLSEPAAAVVPPIQAAQPAPAPTPEPVVEPSPAEAVIDRPPEPQLFVPALDPIPEPLPEEAVGEAPPAEAVLERPPVPTDVAETEAPAPAPAAPAKKYCHKCGRELEPQYRFCLECGTPVL